MLWVLDEDNCCNGPREGGLYNEGNGPKFPYSVDVP